MQRAQQYKVRKIQLSLYRTAWHLMLDGGIDVFFFFFFLGGGGGGGEKGGRLQPNRLQHL